jgi:hypothetical protein
MTNANMQVVFIEVDGDKPENVNGARLHSECQYKIFR